MKILNRSRYAEYVTCIECGHLLLKEEAVFTDFHKPDLRPLCPGKCRDQYLHNYEKLNDFKVKKDAE